MKKTYRILISVINVILFLLIVGVLYANTPTITQTTTQTVTPTYNMGTATPTLTPTITQTPTITPTPRATLTDNAKTILYKKATGLYVDNVKGSTKTKLYSSVDPRAMAIMDDKSDTGDLQAKATEIAKIKLTPTATPCKTPCKQTTGEVIPK